MHRTLGRQGGQGAILRSAVGRFSLRDSWRQFSPRVIDLAFHESKGWVIIDYKTDARPMSHVPALVAHYRGQVETYADAWRKMTGESVAEKGLYFTHAGAYARL